MKAALYPLKKQNNQGAINMANKTKEIQSIEDLDEAWDLGKLGRDEKYAVVAEEATEDANKEQLNQK